MAALALFLPGCANAPGARNQFVVASVAPRGPYLDAVLEDRNSSLRFFFPDTETCRELLQQEAHVEYVALGVLGLVRDRNVSCDPVGIASLAAWRDRRPRPSAPPNPSRPATFSVIYEDRDLALARGRFPLTGLLGWSGGQDTVAVIPLTDVCRPLLERGRATIVFRSSGPNPLSLMGADSSCPILGLVRPLPGLARGGS